MAIENDYSYVKLFRKMFDWEWYTNVSTCKLFIHMLLKANHSDQKWRGEVVKKGTFVTSVGNLASETGLSIQQVRTAIKNLKKTGDIDVKSTNKNTLIIVENYGFYQGMQTTSNKQTTNKQQTSNNQITTNKNDKNDNNIYKEKINKKETYVSLINSYTNNDYLKEELKHYVDMRIKMKGFTIHALELKLKDLDKLATDDAMKIEIVRQSIRNSWKGFFELKDDNFKSKKNTLAKNSNDERNLPQWYQNQKNGVEEEFEQATPEQLAEIEKLLKELG